MEDPRIIQRTKIFQLSLNLKKEKDEFFEKLRNKSKLFTFIKARKDVSTSSLAQITKFSENEKSSLNFDFDKLKEELNQEIVSKEFIILICSLLLEFSLINFALNCLFRIMQIKPKKLYKILNEYEVLNQILYIFNNFHLPPYSLSQNKIQLKSNNSRSKVTSDEFNRITMQKFNTKEIVKNATAIILFIVINSEIGRAHV